MELGIFLWNYELIYLIWNYELLYGIVNTSGIRNFHVELGIYYELHNSIGK